MTAVATAVATAVDPADPVPPRVGPTSVPRLAPHVRLRLDSVRDRWVVMAPERMLVPDEIAVEVLRRVDGRSQVAVIAVGLATDFQGALNEVTDDIVEMLQDLVDKGFVDL